MLADTSRETTSQDVIDSSVDSRAEERAHDRRTPTSEADEDYLAARNEGRWT
jgi:hypothetical protein